MVGFLCCLAFFEFASPTAWRKQQSNNNNNNNTGGNSLGGRDGHRGEVAGGGLVTSIWATVDQASRSLHERWQQRWRWAGGNGGNVVKALSELDGQTSKGGGDGGVVGIEGVAESVKSNGHSMEKTVSLVWYARRSSVVAFALFVIIFIQPSLAHVEINVQHVCEGYQGAGCNAPFCGLLQESYAVLHCLD